MDRDLLLNAIEDIANEATTLDLAYTRDIQGATNDPPVPQPDTTPS